MKLKNTILWICIFCLSACCFGCNNNPLPHSFGEQFTLGNTVGNIYNSGSVVENEEWRFYSNAEHDHNIYKQKLDGSCNTQLTAMHYAYNLNLLGDFIYYTSGLPGEVYCVDINGEKDRLLVYKKVENLIVTNQYMFYRFAPEDSHRWGRLYRADLTGRNQTLLANRAPYFAVDDGWIYFANGEDANCLYKMDFNGENKTKLTDFEVGWINFDLTYIYFREGQNGYLYRISKDGRELQLLSSDDCRGINVHDEYIYYSTILPNRKLYRIKCDGMDKQVIIDERQCSNVQLTASNLFYMIKQSDGGYFKADLNGNHNELWMGYLT